MYSRSLWLAAVAVSGLVLVGATARAADEPSIEGTYDCVGDNGNGTLYRGTVSITKDGDTYKIEWTIARETHVGVGFLDNGRLCSSWAVGKKDAQVIMGAVVYKIGKGKLVGRWCQLPGNGKVLTETLTLRE